ncbi:MAG: galactose mutarotase [Oscillospiraceae bacterium]|nr:galactose mutarotase [Oscillospiraceae bacterium]
MIEIIKLTNKNMSATLTNYGATVMNLFVPDKNNNLVDVILGYDDVDGYINGGSCQGAVMGRFANRIGGAKFTLNGTTYNLFKNDGDNCLHGGSVSFGKRIWEISSVSEDSVTFRYVSPDGEESFPGEVVVTVCYTLTENSLLIEYFATSDGDTVLNLTNHAYFNLGGYNKGDILGTELQIFAENYTPFDKFNIPVGEVAPVKGTVFDFIEPKLIGADNTDYDHNYVLGAFGVMRKAAIAYDRNTSIEMTTFTDMPAMQFYTALHLDEIGKNGVRHSKYGGFCLETQFSPDTPNQPDFEQCILKKGEQFKSTTEYAFSVRKT